MAKVLGHNARIYLNGTVVAHTSEVSLNLDIETEGVTDSNSGIWAAHLPTLNRWNVDFTTWHYGGSANFKTVLNLVRNRTLVTLIYETEHEVQQNGIGYLTNISTSGGTAAGHMQFQAAFIGNGGLFAGTEQTVDVEFQVTGSPAIEGAEIFLYKRVYYESIAITGISPATITHEANYFWVPLGVTSFSFYDDGIYKEAIYDEGWAFEGETPSTTPDSYTDNEVTMIKRVQSGALEIYDETAEIVVIRFD